MTTFEQLVAAVEAAKVDAEKFFGEKANAQAGKRVRAAAKEIADLAKALRKEVSTIKAERAAAKKAA
jgi:hypothetical protein